MNENEQAHQQEAGQVVNQEVAELASLVDEQNGVVNEEPVNEEPVGEGAETPAEEQEQQEETPKEETPEEEAPAFKWEDFTTDDTQVSPEPTPDENGNIDLASLKRHLIDAAKAEIRSEDRLRSEMNRQFDEAEKILPQLKGNKTLAELVRSQALVQTTEGKPLDIVGVAKVLADEFGTASSEGAASERVVIEEESRAGVGGGSQSAPSERETRIKNLEDRVNGGDRDAIQEALDMMMEDGIL